MHLDVLDLRNFYYRTSLGRVAQRAIRDRMVALVAANLRANGGGVWLCRAIVATLSDRRAPGDRPDAWAAGGHVLACGDGERLGSV